MNPADILVRDEGTLVIFSARTQAGEDWLAEHLPEDTPRWAITGYVVEHRYAFDIIAEASGDGLVIA